MPRIVQHVAIARKLCAAVGYRQVRQPVARVVGISVRYAIRVM